MGNMRFAALAAAVVAAVFVGSVEQIAFAEDSHALTVKSVPVSGITITSLQGYAVGTTEYSVVCTDPVRLYAPTNAEVDGEYYRFVRWEVDGTPGNSSTSTYMVMDQDHVAVAVYTERFATLKVQSEPMSGVAIGGDMPGTTHYAVSIDFAHPVTLVAPASATSSRGEFPFVEWIFNGIEQSEGQAAVEVAMDTNYVAVAVYREPHPVLRIGASPGAFHVAIGGDKPGTTDYNVTCDGGEKVRLIAPAEVVKGNVRYTFDYWSVTGLLAWREPEIEITVNFTCFVHVRFKEVPSVLTVRSEPFSGVAIACAKPAVGAPVLPYTITTEYTKKLYSYADVGLSALPVVQHNGEYFAFQRWTLNGVARPDGATGLGFPMDGDKTAVAVYEKTSYLEVLSSPPGVRVEGDRPGTAPYGVSRNGSVCLIAPPSQILDGALCIFNRWEIDGLPQAESQRSITLTLPPDHSVTAIYESRLPRISVASTPITGIPIAGNIPGTTSYTASYSADEPISLQAPETVTVGGVQYRFVMWTMGEGGPYSHEPGIRIDEVWNDIEVTACYTDARPTLTVSSSPYTVSIGGSRPGTTDYTVAGEYLEEVTLKAPATIDCSGQPLGFVRWIVDGSNMPNGETAAMITLRGTHTAVAMYGGNALFRIRGPADRGEPPLPPGGGTFTVDLFVSNAGTFAGFQSVLQFIDTSGNDATFLIGQGPDGNPAFDNLQIAFNDARWPSIFPIFTEEGDSAPEWQRRFFGFLSMQQDAVIGETWLCTVTYEYGPSAEGTYLITGHGDSTMIANYDGEIEYVELPGTVVIGLAADLNNDCIVNDADLLALSGMLGQRGSPGMRGDLNGDGVVNILDLIVLRSRMGTSCR